MQLIKVLALLALASPALAQWCAAPSLKCASTGSYMNSLAVEVSLAGISHANKYTTPFTIQVYSDKGLFCSTTVTPCVGRDVGIVWFGPAPADATIAPWTSTGQCSSTPVPCGTQFVITLKNTDGQMAISTCYSPACPAVASPPYCAPVTIASPPPCVASPPPYVCSPPPVKVNSPPPCVASPPPYVCSPPPVKVNSPPPCVASPPPCVASPPPYVCSPPPVKVNSPPPCVASPPPYCAPVTVKSPPPACTPVTVKSPPPYCAPVTVSKPPPYCAPVKGPQCGTTHWGKPVYCSKGKKCCTVTYKKWYGKHCETYTKQECMHKCPKH